MVCSIVGMMFSMMLLSKLCSTKLHRDLLKQNEICLAKKKKTPALDAHAPPLGSVRYSSRRSSLKNTSSAFKLNFALLLLCATVISSHLIQLISHPTDKQTSPNLTPMANAQPNRPYASVAANASSGPNFRMKRKTPQPPQDEKRPRTDKATPSPVMAATLDADVPELENLFDNTLYTMILDDVDIASATVPAILDELRKFIPHIATYGIRINDTTRKVFIPFKTNEQLRQAVEEYSGKLGTPRDPKTYDPTAPTDVYYRSVLISSNILAWDNDSQIADAIYQVTGAKILNGIVSPQDNLISIYTPTKEDWLKLEGADTIYPTQSPLSQKPGFYVLHKFATTNDPKIFKLWMSGLPEHAHEDAIRKLLTFLKVQPLIIGLAFNKTSHRPMKYCFVIVEGETNRDTLLNKSNSITVKKMPVTFALAHQRLQKEDADRPLT